MTRLALLFALVCVGCAAPSDPYTHSRYVYMAFSGSVGGRLPEPNYLPYVTHQERLPGGAQGLVLCRWPDDAFPLHTWIEPPVISERVQDEWSPRDPDEYVTAVERALARWQEAIGRPVRFAPAASAEDADFVVRLTALLRDPDAGRVGLGVVRDVAARCRVVGRGDGSGAFEIEYDAPETEIFITDPAGLLTPRQVQAVALHEIGHVLGVSGQHSPLAGDVMFKVADDRRVEALSEHDINTLRALYRTPPGTVYVHLGPRPSEPMPEVRRSPPRLDREVVDERYDFRVRFPKGWQVLRSRRGYLAVDGLSWDYDASIQVTAARGEMAAYVAQQGLRGVVRGDIVSTDILEIDGQPVGRIVVRGEQRSELTAILDWEPGWVLLLIADCRAENFNLYQPWFQRVLLSLDHASDRSPEPENSE